jgi:hypothetical protein
MSPTTSHDFDARIQNDEHAVSIKLWQGRTSAEVVDIVGKHEPESYSDQSHYSCTEAGGEESLIYA